MSSLNVRLSQFDDDIGIWTHASMGKGKAIKSFKTYWSMVLQMADKTKRRKNSVDCVYCRSQTRTYWLVQWILTKACFAVWTMFYDWFWYYTESPAEISRVPLWHPSAEFCKDKNKMAARYFKVKYDFSTNEARNKCHTLFSCDFVWAIHFLYYFYHLRSSSKSKSQFQGQISKITIFNK